MKERHGHKKRGPVTFVTLDFKCVAYRKKVVAPAGTHTHTAPPRPVTKAPPAGFGGEGGCLGHDTDSRVTDAAARILSAEVPAPLTVLAVMMAAPRQYPVAIWARSQSLLWIPEDLSDQLRQLGEVRRHRRLIVCESRSVSERMRWPVKQLKLSR